MIIQDMQNDVIGEAGAFADSGAPVHARSQRVVENIRRLAERARARGVMIIHVWFVVEPGAPGMTLNAPLFEGLVDSQAMVRGSWGAAPVAGLEPQPGDLIVEKMRMSAWEGTRLETMLKSSRRDMITLELTRDQVKTAPEYKDKQSVVVLGASGGLQSMPDW